MLRTLIVDDEAPARRRLLRLLEDHEDRLTVVGEAADGVEALDLLSRAEAAVDLLFLDIQMPGLDGFGVLDRLPTQATMQRPAVVFTTAFDEYALKAFEANAVDYLLKPIDEGRLSEAIGRVEERQTPGQRQGVQERLAALLEYLDADDTRRSTPQASSADDSTNHSEPITQLSVPGKDRLIVLPIEDLLAAEVEDGITRLYALTHGPGIPDGTARHIVSYTLDALEQRLDPDAFMRVHRSAIVQLRHIREMISWFSGRYKLVLTGGHEVIASRARSKELRERLSL